MPPELIAAIQKYADARNAVESAGAEIEAIVRRIASASGPSLDVQALIAERDQAVAEATTAMEGLALLQRRLERIERVEPPIHGLVEVPMDDEEDAEDEEEEDDEPEAAPAPRPRRKRATRR